MIFNKSIKISENFKSTLKNIDTYKGTNLQTTSLQALTFFERITTTPIPFPDLSNFLEHRVPATFSHFSEFFSPLAFIDFSDRQTRRNRRKSRIKASV